MTTPPFPQGPTDPQQPNTTWNPGQPQPQPGQYPAGQYPGQAPQYGAPMTQSTPPEKPSFFKSVAGRIIGVVVVIALLSLGGVIVNMMKGGNADGSLTEGKCYTFSGTTKDPDYKVADCKSTDKMTYLVIKSGTGESQCGNEMTEYTTTSKKGKKTYSCMIPNMLVGQCYGDHATLDLVDKYACTDPKAIVKVEKVFEKNDPAQCGDPDTALTFEGAERTYCLAKAK